METGIMTVETDQQFEEQVTSAPSIVSAAQLQRTPTGISAVVLFEDDADGTEAYGYHFAPDDCVPRCVRGYRDLDAGKFGAVSPYTEEMRINDLRVRHETQRIALTSEANEICQPLAEEKDLDIISDEDLVKYKAWVVYRQKLRKVDVTVENPEWPAKPE